MNAPVIAGDKVLLADSHAGAFIALDRATGREVWRVTTGQQYVGPGQAPVVLDGVAYGSAPDTYVYAMDLASGRVRWKRTPAPDGGASDHAVCGRVVFSNHQSLRASRLSDGAPAGSLFAGTDELVTSGFAVVGGRVFFTTNKHLMAAKCP